MKETFRKTKVQNFILIAAGSLIQAAGIANIHAFSDITEGGSLGLTLLLLHFTGISPAITSVILNALCYLIGWRVLGRMFLVRSAAAIGCYALSYALMEQYAPLVPSILGSPLACALLGALFVGVGAGMCVLGGGAPGGDDALAMSLSTRFGWKIQTVYLMTDITVLLLALTYIPVRRIAWSLLTVVLSGQIVGLVQRFKKE